MRSSPDPKVSVVVPTRDRAGMLSVALRTILAQRDVDLELIVVDDASTDHTAAWLEELGDPRLRVIRHHHRMGMAPARNSGIGAARGEWIAFCDDDDLWAPHKLARQLEAAGRSQRLWVYGGDVHVDDRLRVLSGVPPRPPEEVVANLHRWDTVPSGASNVVVRAETLAATGGFDPRLRHLADWDLWIRLARCGLPAWVPEPIVAYRVHATNASFDTTGLYAEVELLEERTGRRVDRRALHRWLAQQSLRSGRKQEALAWLLRAALSRGATPRAVLADLRMLADHARAAIPGSRAPVPPSSAWIAAAGEWLQELAAA